MNSGLEYELKWTVARGASLQNFMMVPFPRNTAITARLTTVPVSSYQSIFHVPFCGAYQYFRLVCYVRSFRDGQTQYCFEMSLCENFNAAQPAKCRSIGSFIAAALLEHTVARPPAIKFIDHNDPIALL
jgi:hypothetical protein